MKIGCSNNKKFGLANFSVDKFGKTVRNKR